VFIRNGRVVSINDLKRGWASSININPNDQWKFRTRGWNELEIVGTNLDEYLVV
jgi:hypothetical protein